MPDAARRVQRTYLLLLLLSTLAASFIWGINTLFLLDAGLTNTEAFTANAAFTLGMVIFEVPTGVVADGWGRRASFILGASTLLVSTVLYLAMWQIEAPLWGWVVSSVVIGLGFTFFSGAVEAWLVDALAFTGYEGPLDPIFGRGQVVSGAAMLTGSVFGGLVAQATNLGVPYVLRAAVLGVTVLAAFVFMKDLGFNPSRSSGPIKEITRITRASVDNGFRNPPMRWLMLAAPFTMGTGIFAFYAMQPYLLELYGDEDAFFVAGLAAAIVAGAQILGGAIVPAVRRRFRTRTTVLITATVSGAASLTLIGFTSSFWVAISLLVVWAIAFSAAGPVRQAYVNGIIPSAQRATVLSFDALMGSTGGVVIQPALGRSADLWGYSTSYVIAGAIQMIAVPFLVLAKRERAASDPIAVIAGDRVGRPVDVRWIGSLRGSGHRDGR